MRKTCIAAGVELAGSFQKRPSLCLGNADRIAAA